MKFKIALFSVLGVIGSILLLLIVSYISSHNYGIRAETQIKAQYENMENILAQYSLQISEAAQIPSMQTDDLVKIFTQTLPARYGANGSKAAFQWITEQNPNLNQESYIKIQQLIEAGRNKFENAQTKLIDEKRGYETSLGYFWRGLWLKIAGYPKINLEDYKIVSSEHAIGAFKTHIDSGLKLRK